MAGKDDKELDFLDEDMIGMTDKASEEFDDELEYSLEDSVENLEEALNSLEEATKKPGEDKVEIPEEDEEDYLDDPEDDLEFVTEETVKASRSEGGALSDFYDADDDFDTRDHKSRKRRRGPVAVLIIVIIIAALAAFWFFYGRNTSWGADLESKIRGFIGKESQSNASSDGEAFAVDEYPEVNALIQKYFDFYAMGDPAKLDVYARPISETEASYIQVYSQYVESYENIKCHTKTGPEDGSYVVSAYMEAKFVDVDTLAPGLETFYVKTDGDGSLYIDNSYSQFNMLNQENAQDETVSDFIEEFEQSDDVTALQQETQTAYEKAVASDENLKTMVEVTIPNAMAEWLNTIGVQEEQEPEETEEQPQEEQPEQEQSVTETVQSDTIYATDNINVRSAADENAEKVSSVVYGTEMSRLAVTDNGWSKVVIDGVSGYVKNDYISTEKPAEESSEGEETSSEPGSTYFPEGQKIVLNEAFNVRATMSESGELMGTAQPGDTVTVILSYAEGWTKVSWGEKIGYIKTSALKTN